MRSSNLKIALFLAIFGLITIISIPATAQNANEQLVKQYFELFNKHEWVKLSEMYAENADFKDPALGPNVVKQSRKQIADKYAGLQKMMSDLKIEVVKMYPSGSENVIVEFVSSGTIPGAGKLNLPICTIFTIKGGKITADHTYYDNM